MSKKEEVLIEESLIEEVVLEDDTVAKKELYTEKISKLKPTKCKIDGNICLIWILEDGIYIRFKNKEEFLIPYGKIKEVIKTNNKYLDSKKSGKWFSIKKWFRLSILGTVCLLVLSVPSISIFLKLIISGVIAYGLYVELIEKNTFMLKISTGRFDYSYIKITYSSESFYLKFEEKCKENSVSVLGKVKNIFKLRK